MKIVYYVDVNSHPDFEKFKKDELQSMKDAKFISDNDAVLFVPSNHMEVAILPEPFTICGSSDE